MPTVRLAAPGFLFAVALLVGREGPPSIGAQGPPTSVTASGALQRGVTLMETRGDCAAALPLFQRAARSAEAAVAARALHLRGQCLERLGRRTDARLSYQELADRFGTHRLARDARARLRVLTDGRRSEKHDQALMLRRIDVHDPVPTGSVSANGRYLAAHDANGVPWRRDLVADRDERIALGEGDVDGTRAFHLLLNADGQQVAYTWTGEPSGVELRLNRAVGGGPPTTVLRSGGLQYIRPAAWAADGRTLLVVTTDADFRLTLQSVDVQARTMRQVYDLGVVDPFFVSLSPDGRRVLFDHAPASGPRDIVMLDLVTAQRRVVVTHPASDVMPVFMPDGRSFLFASDRLGPLSLWRQRFDGASSGDVAPTLIRRDIGRIWAMGMTTTGTFMHGVQTGMIDVHTVRLGADGVVAEQAQPVSATFAGYNQAPDWSPDGSMLVYAATRGALGGGAGARALVIRDHVSGHERMLYPDMLFLNAPRWSPDASRLLVKGRAAASNRWGEFIVDARTATVTPLVTAPVADGEGELGPHQWVPGREAVLLGRHERAIVEVDVATGIETTIVPLGPGINLTAGRGCAYAPDGQTLAWSTREFRPRERPVAVLRVRHPDGSVRELLRAATPDWLMLMDWAPDGHAVYVVREFAARPGATPTRTELWRIPIDGSAPTRTGLAARALRGVSIHPDGKTIAYVTGLPAWEIWALEGIRE